MLTARIIGTGSYLPDKIIKNSELAKRVPDKSDENEKGFDVKYWKKKLSEEGVNVEELDRDYFFNDWVIRVAGPEKRHIYNDIFGEQKNFKSYTEEMGTEAAKKALEMAGVKAEKLNFIIECSFTNHYEVPNGAVVIGHLIGKDIGYESLTINTACSGFIQGLILANRAIKLKEHKNVLVVASETLSKVTNYNDAKTSILFADGAGAAVLTADEKGILGSKATTGYNTNITLENHVGYLVMGEDPKKSSEVLKSAVRGMEEVGRRALELSNLSLEKIDYIIPHQANQRITKSLRERLEFPDERVVKTIKDFGNTSAASVAIALDKALRGEIENIKVEKGNKLLLTAFGGGYTSAGLVMEY